MPPGFRHSVTVKMFRNSGELARAIVGLLVELPAGPLVATAAANDLSEPLPVEYRADQVMAYRQAGQERAELAIIVEVQHKVDVRKAWTWMSYVANAAADHECGVMLLVVTWNARVAAWAKGPFASGHPGFELVPLVVDLSTLPTLLAARASALQIPELAVLCALAKRDAPSVKVAIEALRGLPSDRAKLYWTAIAKALSPSDGLTLEKQMENLAADARMMRRKLPRLSALIAEPFEERGRKRGRAEGRVAALQAAALEMLKAKLGKVSSAEVAAIRSLSEPRALLALIVQLGATEKAQELRAHVHRAGKAGSRARGPASRRRAA